MYEFHENEQYFFSQRTIDELETFLQPYEYICCLCAPSLGKRLSEKGKNVRILDIDEHFHDINDYKYFDIHRPQWLGEKYSLIVCDPPFFTVSLSRLFAAIRMLSLNDFSQPLMISYLDRRAGNVCNTFAKFDLKATGYFPTYQTVRKCEKNDIRFFSNLDSEMFNNVTM